MGGDKTKEECEQHYEELYMQKKEDSFVPKNMPILSSRDENGSLVYLNKHRSKSEELLAK